MIHLAVNTTFEGRYLLNEQISPADKDGQQVWAVLDTQTNQRLIGKFASNGQVTWFNDNRPVAGPAKPLFDMTAAITQPAPPVATPAPAKPRPNLPPQTKPAPTNGRRVVYFLSVLLLAGAFMGAYTQREVLLTWLNAKTTTAVSVTSADSAGLVTESTPGLTAAQPPPNPTLIDGLPPTGWSVQQTSQLLKKLAKLPTAQHPVVFAEASKALIKFRSESPDEDLVDSLYMAYATCGAASSYAHDQNGDSTSKQYAIWWYQMARAVSPRPEVAGLLSRLQKTVPIPKAKPAARARATPNTRNPGFMTDPELNQ